MNDLETIVRRLIREEIRSALEELIPHSQDKNSTRASEPEDGLLLSTRDAAKRLAISERTLFTLTQSGQLPCVRVGIRKRYSVETLRNWIQRSEAQPSPRMGARVRTSVCSVPTTKTTRKRIAKIGSVETTKKSKPLLPPNGNVTAQHASKATDQPQPLNPFSLLLAEIGVDRSDLPPMTNGDLMRIAEVDVSTFHGWHYLHRPMAQEAIEKLQRHFLRYKRQD
jgi:excisionase family DNA binding protein